MDEQTSNTYSNFINFNKFQSQLNSLLTSTNKQTNNSTFSTNNNNNNNNNNETGNYLQNDSSKNQQYHFLRSNTSYNNTTTSNKNNSNDTSNSVTMLINSRPFTLSTNNNNHTTPIEASSLSVNPSLIASVSYRNYLALHDRALSTLNSNTLVKQNSYSGTPSGSFNPYETPTTSNHLTSHYESDLKQQQLINTNNNLYNSRSKSVSTSSF